MRVLIIERLYELEYQMMQRFGKKREKGERKRNTGPQ